jgi:hypothetical protein
MKAKSKKNIITVVIISGIYFFYRIANSLIVDSLFDEYDSPNYFKLSFFPSIRTHGITLFFSLIKNESAITLFQASVGALVWIYLWLSILFKIKNLILSALFSFLFFTLASSSVVIEHDSAMMSESLSISSTVFLFGSAINLSKKSFKDSSMEVYIFTFAIIWFMSTKATSSLIFIPLAVITFFITYRKLSKPRFFQLFCSFLVLGTFLFLSVLASDATQSLTTSGTINNRLIFVPEWRDQLIKSGYPETAFKEWERFSQKNLGKPPDQAVVSLPEFKKWWEQGGDNYLLNFTLRNPDYALIGPVALPLFSENFNYKKTLLSGWSQGTDLTFDYSQFNNSLLNRTFLWPDEPEKAYLVLAATFLTIGVSLAFLNKFNFSIEFSIIFFAVILTIFWSYLNWWFGSKPADMARHNINAAILFKIIALYAMTISINKISTIKKSM